MIVAVIGLGYVGLPLVVAFGQKVRTIGFDIDDRKVTACQRGTDPSREIDDERMRSALHAQYRHDPACLAEADFLIVAVPTPVDNAHIPDFQPLKSASELVGRYMKPGAIVIYESTVYPGATEEICIPILERESGKQWKRDFFVGYSPERINPGDREHVLTNVIKVVSADTDQTLDKVAALYESIVAPGVHRCGSIKVAEAAKVIENTQRDLNIALMNELSMIFQRIGIDTHEVLTTAGTKWNFLKFWPGLVGGHCIGVDPYYLTYKAEQLGYHPQVILAGRRINDSMGKYVAEQTVKKMLAAGHRVHDSRVNVLGLSFKENCSDIRNTKVIDLIHELESYGIKVAVHDPHADAADALREYRVPLTHWDALPRADAIVLAVAHRDFLHAAPSRLAEKLTPNGVVIDVKSALDRDELSAAGISVWRL